MANELPEELIIDILLHLGVGDLKACQQVCRRLTTTISLSAALQHKVHLATYGMTGGPGCREHLSTSLAKLQSYNRMWSDAKFKFEPLFPSLSGNAQLCEACNGVLAFNVGSTMRITRQPSDFAQVADRTHVLTHCLEDVLPDFTTVCCAVDLDQDLLVLVKRSTLTHAPPRCYFFSLCKDSPHPKVRRQFVESLSRKPTRRTDYGLDILGDLLVWSMADHRELQVWNWQKGTCLYSRYFSTSYERALLLDIRNLLVITVDGINVIRIDPEHTDIHLTPMQDLIQSSHYVLRFPPTVGLPFTPIATCHFQRPALFPECSPLFLPDPANTILAVYIRYLVDFAGDVQTYVLLIPLATIAAQLKGTADRCSSSTVLSWQEWGSEGTRIIKLRAGASIDAYGSRCAILTGSGEPGIRNLVVFDAHPWADINQDPGVSKAMVKYLGIQASDQMSGGKVFVEPIRSTLPYRVLHKQVVVGESNREKFKLTHSGAALLLDHAPSGDKTSWGGVYSLSI